MSLDFKIGMTAPSKAGKTSLMTAIFYEMKTRLAGNPQGIQYWADSKATQNAISRAIAEFQTCTVSDEIFAVPQLAGTETVSNYKFAFTIPADSGIQRLNIDIMDYPGGLLGTPDFAEKVMPHLTSSPVLLIPIPADILMEWKRTNGVNRNRDKRINIAAHVMLDVDNVIRVIKDWAGQREQQNENALLIFVPIRSEAYFNDNGGANDTSQLLHTAIQELYVDTLHLTPEMKKKIQIETHAVDTYGIVELRDIELKTLEEGEFLVSNFRKRLCCKNELKVKGALEVLASVIQFRLNEYAGKLGIERKTLEEEIKKRNFLESFWAWLTGDAKKQALMEYIQKHGAAFQAMAVVSQLKNCYPAREKILNYLQRSEL